MSVQNSGKILKKNYKTRKLRNFKTNKISSKCDSFELLNCYPMRFHEEKYENSKQIKIRENTTVLLLCLTAISREKLRKITKSQNKYKFL